MKRSFPDDVHAVLGGLWRVFQRVGRGSMTRTARALDLRPSYFSEKRSRPPETFDVGVLLATLRSLGVEAVAFFRELEPEAHRVGEIWEGPEPLEERPGSTSGRSRSATSTRWLSTVGRPSAPAGSTASTAGGRRSRRR